MQKIVAALKLPVSLCPLDCAAVFPPSS